MDGMGVPRYVSPLYALIRDNNVTEGGIKNYCVTDDVALVVDRAVAKLATRDAQMGNFIWLYFGAKWPALRIARENDMGEAEARELIKAGVAWVDCAIEVFREVA
ncbi:MULTISPECIES: antitermination protein Q [Pseudomonas]|uniref:Antitermination protein Q n=1 Tax=Pseudomonas azadiae TaxID=2843612 RepID=A0ABS6NWY7_9PSED|nr:MULTISPECIES: antitermination protein Q [Pseudomonas]MBV4452728.1 antitermination protein Q [Pseudomonas azadiae]NMF42452.1 antitermination protein Q [Pseudomonas sp. SWRI 103]